MEITLMDILKDAIDERVNKGRQEERQYTQVANLRSIMKALGFTAEKAMDTLEIPQNQRAVYSELLKQA